MEKSLTLKMRKLILATIVQWCLRSLKVIFLYTLSRSVYCTVILYYNQRESIVCLMGLSSTIWSMYVVYRKLVIHFFTMFIVCLAIIYCLIISILWTKLICVSNHDTGMYFCQIILNIHLPNHIYLRPLDTTEKSWAGTRYSHLSI